jgi:GAF domain-containing protein
VQRRGRERAPPARAGPGQASLQIAGNQELDSALAQIGEMLVPHFADHCFIDVVADDLFIRRMQRHAGGWTPPPGTWVPTGGQIRFPAGHFCQQAMALLDTVLVTDMTRASFPAPSAPSKALSMELELTSVLAAPLYINGTLLGVISMARSRLTSRTQPNYTTCDRDLLTALANEVAIAIRNAQRQQSPAATSRTSKSRWVLPTSTFAS